MHRSHTVHTIEDQQKAGRHKGISQARSISASDQSQHPIQSVTNRLLLPTHINLGHQPPNPPSPTKNPQSRSEADSIKSHNHLSRPTDSMEKTAPQSPWRTRARAVQKSSLVKPLRHQRRIANVAVCGCRSCATVTTVECGVAAG